ncbi:MAG: hypothetical protein ACLR3C_11415 [Eggerthella lenta]
MSTLSVLFGSGHARGAITPLAALGLLVFCLCTALSRHRVGEARAGRPMGARDGVRALGVAWLRRSRCAAWDCRWRAPGGADVAARPSPCWRFAARRLARKRRAPGAVGCGASCDGCDGCTQAGAVEVEE